jgi:hypothetical protein
MLWVCVRQASILTKQNASNAAISRAPAMPMIAPSVSELNGGAVGAAVVYEAYDAYDAPGFEIVFMFAAPPG